MSCITSLKSIFAVPSKDTPCIVLALARAVVVEELPATSPTKEVAANILLATSLLLELSQRIVGLEEEAPNSIPAPLVFESVVAPLATLIVASSTSKVAVFSVTVSPFTVRSPVTVKSLPIVTSSGRLIVTVAPSEPDPDTVISFEVPAIVAT